MGFPRLEAPWWRIFEMATADHRRPLFTISSIYLIYCLCTGGVRPGVRALGRLCTECTVFNRAGEKFEKFRRASGRHRNTITSDD